ncbi:aminoglycoside phosphotransferase family protein [Glycomyces buryatensis]|uniref:Aminoglycoside phosphotransferase family protein n=1 Tax=Glycomyces buryatensis TaxID=2570927 RepID=A0A4S8PTL0_9ACTN|nr:aminoglycoside phosphotransferase family protein [Glycomyces buryatensis]THV33671.1 aminoglycoside phosphotransferase family protein [Glycomyces buryatensis]
MGDYDIDENFVRALLEEQHPDLAELELRPTPGGWDNRMWRLGEDLAVRIPLTANAPTLLRNEHRWLPILAPRLPLPVPVPARISEPSERFARPWIITTWVPGEPADRAPLTRVPQAAEALAGFLRALHLPAPPEAPVSPGRGVSLGSLPARFEHQMEYQAQTDIDAVHLRDIWDDAVAAPEWTGPPVWLHGDLHPANVVVADGTLAGVIDFGDLCGGDPATDLASAWLLLPDGEAKRFFAAYGGADAATIRRARGWALLGCLSLMEIGHAGDMGWPGGKPTWGPAGRAAMERLLVSGDVTGLADRP